MMLRSTLLRCSVMLALLIGGSTSVVHAQNYCQPTYGTPCTVGGDFIQSFSTTGGTTNITNNNTGCSGNANNYQYYATQTVTTAPGGSFAFSFTNSNTQQHYKIWVDWNGNGLFTDAGEEVYASATGVGSGATINGTISVPATTTTGLRRLRIRSQFFTNPVTPCGNALYGETEDYNVQVGSALGCNTVFADSAYATPPVACLSGTVTLGVYNYSSGPGITYTWQTATALNGPWALMPFSSIPAVVTQTSARYYRLAVTCAASNQTAFSYPVYVPMGSASACLDSVWPGDANYDLIANNLDVLALATNFGLTGPVRAGASNAYVAQFAMNWTQSFANGINKKNVDCDGNGSIGWSDTVAISQNYGMVHLRGAEEDAPSEKTAGLPDLFVDLAGIPMTPGTTITAPIRFGNASSPVTRIYGVAATVKMSGTATVGSPSIALNPTWMGSPAQVLRFAKNTGSTTADFVASRITRRDTAGFGTLGTVSFSIPANATGKVKVGLQGVRLIDSTGAILTAYNVVSDSANIISTGIDKTASDQASAAIVPNPGATSVVEIHLAKATRLEVLVADAVGKVVWKTSVESAGGTQHISLPQTSLPTGVYSVRIQTAGNGNGHTLRWLKH